MTDISLSTLAALVVTALALSVAVALMVAEARKSAELFAPNRRPRDKKWQKKARREAWAPEKEDWQLDAEEHGWRPPTGPTHRTASGQVLRMPPWQPPRNPRPPGPEAPTPQCPPAPLPPSPPPGAPAANAQLRHTPVTYYRVED